MCSRKMTVPFCGFRKQTGLKWCFLIRLSQEIGCEWVHDFQKRSIMSRLPGRVSLRCGVDPGFRFPLALSHFSVSQQLQLEEELDTKRSLLGEDSWQKMFNILMLLLPALACVARDPTEGKEKVHSFYVKYNVSFVSDPCWSHLELPTACKE